MTKKRCPDLFSHEVVHAVPHHEYLAIYTSRPLLTADEERALSKRSLAGDSEARNELVTRNLRLAMSIASRSANRGIDVEDLFQVAVTGLIRAATDYDGSTRFSTYATWWVFSHLAHEFREHTWTVRIYQKGQTLLKKFRDAEVEFFQQHRRWGVPSEVAQSIGMSNVDLENTLCALVADRGCAPILQRSAGMKDDFSPGCVLEQDLADRSEPTFDAVDHADERAKLESLIDTLPQRWQIVVRRQLNGDTNLAIADDMRLSHQRIAQIATMATKRMQETYRRMRRSLVPKSSLPRERCTA